MHGEGEGGGIGIGRGGRVGTLFIANQMNTEMPFINFFKHGFWSSESVHDCFVNS